MFLNSKCSDMLVLYLICNKICCSSFCPSKLKTVVIPLTQISYMPRNGNNYTILKKCTTHTHSLATLYICDRLLDSMMVLRLEQFLYNNPLLCLPGTEIQ